MKPEPFTFEGVLGTGAKSAGSLDSSRVSVKVAQLQERTDPFVHPVTSSGEAGATASVMNSFDTGFGYRVQGAGLG